MASASASVEEATEAVPREGLNKRSPERYHLGSPATFSAAVERISSGAATMDQYPRQRMLALIEELSVHAAHEQLWIGGSAPRICEGFPILHGVAA